MTDSLYPSKLDAPAEPASADRKAATVSLFAATLVLTLLLLEAALAAVGWINTHVLQHAPLPAFAVRCAFLYAHILLLAGALIALERFFPGSSAPKRYGQAALFWACYVPVAVASSDIAHLLIEHFGITPFFSLNFDTLKTSGVSAVGLNAALILLSAFLFDFFYYWFHRLQHTTRFLWAFHSVHHANRSLNVLGCYHHPLEDLWRIPLFLLPMAVTFQIVAPPLVLVSAFVTAWGIFNHMDSSFSLGRLRHALADNHYHRLHHSMAKEHFNKNFAGMFSPWDKLFGTQAMPGAGVEKLPVGLDGVGHPRTLWQYLRGPFLLLGAMLRGRKGGSGGE